MLVTDLSAPPSCGCIRVRSGPTSSGDGDRERALSLIDDALTVARRRGYSFAARRATELLSSAGR